MQKNLILSSLLTIGLIGALQAQVGIGTMNPNAQLTIDSGVSGIAPLELTDLSSAPNTNLAGGQLAVINEDVNPNKVYLLGYSAGGDGVYQLAPRMADRWAAAAMMADSPINCKNS